MSNKILLSIIVGGSLVAVGLGGYLYFAVLGDETGEHLPRFAVEAAGPEQREYAVGESFQVELTVTTVVPELQEYEGTWDTEEPYQPAFMVDGFLFTDGPFALTNHEVRVEKPERATPPQETERMIFPQTATVTCSEEGDGYLTFSYTVNQENLGVQTFDIELGDYSCVPLGPAGPDDGGAMGQPGTGAQPEVTVPTVQPGIQVRGLEGLKMR